MKDFNSVSFTGRLGSDPEIRSTPQGKSVANFNIAVNGFKDDEVMWLRVNCWERLADTASQFLHKGSKAIISGSLSIRAYEKDGQQRQSVEVTAREIVFLDTKGSTGGQSQTPSPRNQEADVPPLPASDDLPF